MDAGPRPVRTTCPYCGVGCGVLAEVAPDGAVAVRGDPDHPANFGRLCSKGAALADILSLDGRLLHPEIGGRRATWDEALDLVARRFSETIAADGPDAVAFYVSGQLLTEDYYVANKLMKGFIGSANIDTNSRLCMASAVAGHRRAFGADVVPCSYSDLEEADLVVLVGSNLAWCHPVLFQRLLAAKEKRGTAIVVVDPRQTPTAEGADLHLAPKPGADVALFAGLLAHLARAGAVDRAFVAACTDGLDAALAAAAAMHPAEVAGATGLAADALGRFYRLFERTERVVTVFSQGVNQAADGTDRVNAIINCHLATGRIGRPGAGPFSITGQPNAMGGREVGGLANQLAAHMGFDDPADIDRVRRFWKAPRVAARPGLKAVDLFRAVAGGRVKALWIMATNPVDSMPEADAVAAALAACPFVVVSDVVGATDTARHADVLLPAAAWGEKDGTVTNSERRISRQRAFRVPPGEARPDWRIVADVARRMGHAEAFAFESPAAVFREHAALSSFENGGRRAFDLAGLAGIDDRSYDRLAPQQWPVQPAGDGARLFADGRFFTPGGRARFVATPPAPPAAPLPAFPLVLNTGRLRDQWHTMTRTGISPRLSAHAPEPVVEIDRRDAEARGILAGSLVEVVSPHARMLARAPHGDGRRAGAVFVPMHWTDRFASAARVDALVAAEVDPVSGQPALKSSPVEVSPFLAAWHGFAVVADRPPAVAADYWALARVAGGFRLELAGTASPADWAAWARSFLPETPDGGLLAFHDAAGARHRFAAFDGERLVGAVFVAASPLDLARTFLVDALPLAHPLPADRLRLLAGRPSAGRPDPGPMVCSCFGVGMNQIVAAVAGGVARSVEAVGAALRAGTNCGSCRPEIRRIVDAKPVHALV
jgi:assimilatory nitrate reductase catalytic subunit